MITEDIHFLSETVEVDHPGNAARVCGLLIDRGESFYVTYNESDWAVFHVWPSGAKVINEFLES